MSAEPALTTEGIIGEFYELLDNESGVDWVDKISVEIPSTQETEKVRFLGMSTGMRERKGQNSRTSLNDFGIDVVNKEYENTLEFSWRELEQDKTGQVSIRLGEQAEVVANHWAELLTDRINNGGTETSYDGQFMYDTDHVIGSSGTIDNAITVDISALPTQSHGDTTTPSSEEINLSILKGIEQLKGFKDDQGKTTNRLSKNFLVMVPVNYWMSALSAVGSVTFGGNATNTIAVSKDQFNIEVVANPDLTATDKIYIFITDSRTKAFIRTEDFAPEMLGSDEEFWRVNKKREFTVFTSRSTAPGQFLKTVSVQLI